MIGGGLVLRLLRAELDSAWKQDVPSPPRHRSVVSVQQLQAVNRIRHLVPTGTCRRRRHVTKQIPTECCATSTEDGQPTCFNVDAAAQQQQPQQQTLSCHLEGTLRPSSAASCSHTSIHCTPFGKQTGGLRLAGLPPLR